MAKRKSGMTKRKGNIAVCIVQRKHGNQHGHHTKIAIGVDLGFHANLTQYEQDYLINELKVAVRTALIMQFGLRAEIVAPEVKEPEDFALDLFKVGG